MTSRTTGGEASDHARDAAPPSRSATVIAWVVVGLAAIAIAVWFALPSEDGAGVKSRGPAAAHAVPVSAAAVVVGALVERGTWPGELTADAADIPSLVVGRLKSVDVRVGGRVEAGALLAEVDTVELGAQLEAARASGAVAAATARRFGVELDAARRELKRAQALAADGLLSAQELAERRSTVDAALASVRVAQAQGAEAGAGAEVLAKRLAEAKITAPFAGTIALRYVDPGAYVSPGTPVVRLVADAPLRVLFEVPSGAIAGLRAAEGFEARAAVTGAREVHGELTGVAGEVKRDRRVVSAEGVIDNPPEHWLPGMFVEVLLPRRSASDAPIVPASALIERVDDAGRPLRGVFVADGAVARWVPATVLARDGPRIALDAALPAGASVLVSGHSDLADGSPIAVTPGDAAATQPPAGGGAPR